ncbi:MAG: hypothetical protein QNK05_16470 [Myxococcota bacterium]|nr:hypothetical protein [Myxococcota bacterium]
MAEDRKARDMIDGMLSNLSDGEGEAMQGLTLDDLKDAMSHPEAAKTVAELMPIEAASVKAGDPAPDFTLPYLPGIPGSGTGTRTEGESVTLSSHFGERPVALIFGSYT